MEQSHRARDGARRAAPLAVAVGAFGVTFGVLAQAAGFGRGLHSAAQLLYGRDSDKPAALRRGAGPLLKLARRSLRGAFRR